MDNEFAELLRLVKARERVAWENLIERSGKVIWGILHKFNTLTGEDRQDVFQSVWLALLERGLGQFKGSTEHEWRYYLRTVVIHETISFLRRSRREIPHPFGFGLPDDRIEPLLDRAGLTAAVAGPEQQAAVRETRQQVRGCLQRLPPVEQEILSLWLRQVAFRDMAHRLGLPQGTVASKYDRAKKKLRQYLTRSGFI